MENFRAGIITVSDRSYNKIRPDLSGPEIEKWASTNNILIAEKKIVPDEIDEILKALHEMFDRGCDLIITTGGTGISNRDCTPEATELFVKKRLPGFSELMRMKSYDITENSVLSRAVCGIKGKTIIINLPGSPGAVNDNLKIIEKPLFHALQIITGRIRDCSIANKQIKIHIVKGNIVNETSDAIVNAANTSLLGGGGVDGDIHKHAGPELLEECKKLNGCRTGEAVLTGAYRLKSKYIIHTPGPVYKDGGNNENKLLSDSYLNTMKLALKNGVKSMSFPAISTGVYRFPKEEACEIAIKTVYNFILDNNYDCEIRFVLFDDENYNLYEKELRKYK